MIYIYIYIYSMQEAALELTRVIGTCKRENIFLGDHVRLPPPPRGEGGDSNQKWYRCITDSCLISSRVRMQTRAANFYPALPRLAMS